MSDINVKNELQTLLRDAQTHLEYLRELGIEYIPDNAGLTALGIEESLAPSVLQAVSPPPARTSSALFRNANEAARTAPKLESNTIANQPIASPDKLNADKPNATALLLPSRFVVPPSPLARPVMETITEPLTASSTVKLSTADSDAAPQNANPIMPTKPDASASDLLLNQDSLFGEITPKDEASLPQSDETMEDIRRDIGECTRCPLYQGRTKIVHTEGSVGARLMFVGEAPGADEDASGRPFVGRAGQLLNKIIEAIGLKREDVLIGNVNRCRPPGNRTPTLQEAKTCKPFLLRDIAVAQPEVLVVMGNTAMKNLLDTKEGITKLRGEFQDYKGIKVMPTFHPAYLLRDPSKKRETWDDMKKVRDYLQANPRKETKSEEQAQNDLGLKQRDEAK